MKNVILLFAASAMLAANIAAQEVGKGRSNIKRNNFENTYWLMRVGNNCSNYYSFNKHGSYVYYSCEQNEYSPGVFSIMKDTLFLHEFYSDEDDSFDILNKEVKFIGFLSGNSIHLLYREDLIKTKDGELRWLKTKLDKPATFRKTVQSKNK